MSSSQIILHWYPASPFAQKVAWALQYKNIDFKVVVITPTEPRPLRRPLDGGYRKTPILQIGNHTYCDSKMIFAELEKRFPEPSLYPEGTESLAIGVGRWTDSTLFPNVVTQIPFKMLGEAFIKDRSQVSGAPINADKAAMVAPYMFHTLKSEIDLVNSLVKEKCQKGDLFALGTKTLSLVDLHISMNLWFLSNFAPKGWLQKEYPILDKLLNKTLVAVRFTDLKKLQKISAEDALKIAKAESWESDSKHDGSLKIPLGSLVSVTPTDNGKNPSIGKLVYSTVNETVIEHVEDSHGFTSYTHFPVMGFLVLPHESKL